MEDYYKEHLLSNKSVRFNNPLAKGDWDGLLIALYCGLYNGEELDRKVKEVLDKSNQTSPHTTTSDAPPE